MLNFNKGNDRSNLVKSNIVGAFLNKGIAIVISLLLVPATIGYLDSEQYGIWLTISSIVAWISYFDIGLVNGFKNRFTESKAHGNIEEARKYVSTTYIVMLLVFAIVVLVAEVINPFMNWASFLHLPSRFDPVLHNVVFVLLLFVGLQFVLGVMTALLNADQRNAYSSFISTLGQGAALIVIYLLTKFTSPSMVYVCIALSGMPCLVLLIVTIRLFSTRYKIYAPSYRFFRIGLIKNIFSLGVKFFVIQISMLLIFQVTNVILSREVGAESVTVYNVTYKYFSVFQMFFNILLSPFWSAYTDAYTKHDYIWMRKSFHKLLKIYIFALPVMAIMFICYPFVFKIWLSGKVDVSWTIALGMCIYIVVLSFSNMVMILINGTGKVFLQMILYLICASVSIPLMVFLCSRIGLLGILVVLSFVYALQACCGYMQLNKILMKKSKGIWNK